MRTDYFALAAEYGAYYGQDDQCNFKVETQDCLLAR